MQRRPGSSWGFGALLKGTSVMVLKVEIALYINSTHPNSCQTEIQTRNDYEFDSLTIRPRLPPMSHEEWDTSKTFCL